MSKTVMLGNNTARAICVRRLDVTSRQLKAGEVHDGFDEDGVVADVRVLALQLGQRTEERTSAGDVHLADRPLERRRGDVGPEGVDDVLSVTLVQQHQRDLTVRSQT